VALDGGRYVGLVFHVSGSPALLIVEVTGTARAYRRRGIAQALKLKSMAWAKQAGFSSLLVNNDLSNAGMLAINDKLGFERQPALIMLQRKAPF
jgi:GNAT superfamily N-acetyltransferase